MLGTDNHTSRFDETVLRTANAAAEGLGIRLFMEEAKTSQFLQMPDQLNKQCHSAYTKGRKEYKIAYKQTYGEEPKIGVCEFLENFGGCRELNFEGVWFAWCSSQNVLAAWRKVGFAGCGLMPEHIDRSGFIDRAEAITPDPPPAALPPLAEAIKTPPGERRGSLAAERAKLSQALTRISLLEKRIEELEKAPFDPATILGLMAPKVHRPLPLASHWLQIFLWRVLQCAPAALCAEVRAPMS